MDTTADCQKLSGPPPGPWRVVVWWMMPLTVAVFALSASRALPQPGLVWLVAGPLVCVQVALANLAFVFSPEPFVRRMGWLAIVALPNALALQAGAMFGSQMDDQWRDMMGALWNHQVWAAVPLLLLTSQIPFWGLRFIEGWQLLRQGQMPEPTAVDRTVRLGDLLALMGLLGVALACGRLLSIDGAIAVLFWGLLGGTALLAIAFPLAILFLERVETVGGWTAALLVYPGLWLVPAGWMGLIVARESGAGMSDPEFLGWAVLLLVVVPWLLTVGLAGAYGHLRRNGWRLERVYARPPGNSPSSSHPLDGS